MMNRPDGPRTVAFALCGSFCSFSAVLPQVRRLRALGWRVLRNAASTLFGMREG